MPKRSSGSIISAVMKPVGMVLSPLAFALVIVLVTLLALNQTIGDVIGYGQVLFMEQPANNDAENIFEPSAKNSGTVNIKDVTFPTYERVYGHITIDSGPIDCPLVYGDTETAIARGAGQYIGSRIIGYGGTTLICAHINRQFANLHNVKAGDYIKIATTYGSYVYKVSYAGVNAADDKTVFDLSREDENVVLYTCYYQRTAFGSVKMRYFVCADYVSGPMIVDVEVSQ